MILLRRALRKACVQLRRGKIPATLASAFSTLLILGLASGCTTVAELLQQELESGDVACTTDALFTTPQATAPVRLRGWTAERGHGAPSFEWSTSAGRIQGTGAEVEWDLADAELDTHRAVVMARDTAGRIGLCTVQVHLVVGFPVSLPSGIALLRGGSEAAGYGVYSYLLLPVRPSPGSRLRLTRALEFFARVRADVAPDHTRRDIVLYTPIAADSASPQELGDAGWILANYDHDRAREFLGRAGTRPRQDGPYLVVASTPLAGTRRGEAIVSDLSGTPPDLMDAWIRHHLFLAAGEGSWTEVLRQRGVLRLRTILNEVAEALPAIRQGLDEAVRLVRVE